MLYRISESDRAALFVEALNLYMDEVKTVKEILLENKRSGVYHLCNSGEPESWMSYAEKVCLLAQDCGYDTANAELIETAMTEATFFREKRPLHTAMIPARMLGEGLVSPRHWMEAAKEYLKMR